jgi:acyl-coenzyme A thioesterase PaaI-like protein
VSRGEGEGEREGEHALGNGPAGPPGLDGPPASIADGPRNRLAAAMRRLSAVAVGPPVDEEEIARAAVELGALADRLESAAPAARRTLPQPGPGGFPGRHPQDYFPASPVVGFENPLAPPVEVWAVEGEDGRRELRGRATFGYAYEGPPTCVHGGVIAELFDELLGISNLLTEQGAMTGTLKIRYRRPTPLLAPLDLVARNTGQEGRKICAWGAITYQGELTAEADGIFIHVPSDRMLEIVSGNARGSEAPLVDTDWRRTMTPRTVCGREDHPPP